MKTFTSLNCINILLFTTIFGFTQNVWSFDYFQPLPTSSLIPSSNQQNKPKIALGRQLFFDTYLSVDKNRSCNECHNLLLGGDDDKALSSGHNGKQTKRSAPTLWNIGLQTVLFWDGRAKSLETALLEHLATDTITGTTNIEVLVQAIKKKDTYQRQFQAAFSDKQINSTNIVKAISSFLRTLLAANSPFDRYLLGNKNALTSAALKGKELFTEVGCLACHFGVNFAGPAPGPAMGMGDGFYELFPNNLGSKYDKQYNLTDDLGRYEFSKIEDEKYMWRVPPLRNIALTGPYFHNGSAKTLHEAIKIMGKTQFNRDLSTQQINYIVAFLLSLTGELPTSLHID